MNQYCREKKLHGVVCDSLSLSNFFCRYDASAETKNGVRYELDMFIPYQEGRKS